MKRCEAKNRKGSPCQRLGSGAGGRCRMHGGASPVGIASPHFITGRYSRHLPVRLAELCVEAITDTRLLSLRDELSLADVRIAELLTQLSRNEAGDSGDEAGDRKMVKATEFRTPVREQDDAIWREILLTIECRRRLAASEWRRLVEMQQILTTEQAMAMIGRITAIIRENVTDPEERCRISDALNRMAKLGDDEGEPEN